HRRCSELDLRNLNSPRSRTCGGKIDPDLEPSSRGIGSTEFAAMESNPTLAECQAQPCAPRFALSRRIEPEKRAKQLVERRIGYSGPMIANLDDGGRVEITRFADQANLDFRLVRRVPNRIADNIFDRTAEELWAAYRAAVVRLVKDHPAVAIAGLEVGIGNDLAKQIGKLDFLLVRELLAGFHSRKGKQLPDHSIQPLRLLFYAGNCRTNSRTVHVANQLDCKVNPGQRRPELVGYVANQPFLRRHQ